MPAHSTRSGMQSYLALAACGAEIACGLFQECVASPGQSAMRLGTRTAFPILKSGRDANRCGGVGAKHGCYRVVLSLRCLQGPPRYPPTVAA
eukprot:1903341-Rhodomonas_salina.1